MKISSFATIALFSIFTLPAFAGCPSLTAGSYTSTLNYNSDSLWTERRLAVRAGGAKDLSNCSRIQGVGHVASKPDFQLHFTSNDNNRMLRIKAVSDCDTVLVVNTPSASWRFNDDDDELNPVLRFNNAPTGRYDIWVGTYGGSYCDATLLLETF